MKKAVLLCLLVISIIAVTLSPLAAQSRKIGVTDAVSGIRLTDNNSYGFELEFKTGELKLEEVKTKGGVFDEIFIENFGHSNRTGEPKLPLISRVVTVPVGATVSFDILSESRRAFTEQESRLLHRIMPAQPSVSKSDDPEKIPFEINESLYRKNAFTTNELFNIYEIGYMRGARVFQIEFEPVRYNPVSGEIVVSYDVRLRVNFHNPDFAATEELLAKTASYEFDRVYARTIFNWRNEDRPSLVRYPTKYLILCPPNYVSTLQPFVDWKRQQGYNVIVTTVGSGGSVNNSTSAINTYMAGVWSAATAENPAPTYLLIVGDTSTSGDNIIANTGATSSAHVTDLTYVRLQGSDYLPEMYYGRFSVSSATELTNIINKTLMFQQTTMPDMSYLGNVVMIAGADASYAPTYGNGQINYGTTHYFNSTNGITSNTYLYPESASSDAQIIANANEGRGYMNYTAHGSETSWADPTFTTTNLNNMTNTNKYFVAVGNCCITNKFNHSSPCFGEVVIRAANKAGVAYIGGTNNTYWDEDYWWGIGYKTPIQATPHAYNSSTLGAYDAMFHTHGEAFADWAQTVGETVYMGNSAVQQSSSSRKNYYWEIYSIMGDPSLMPYYGVPSVNTATYPSPILINASSITVTAAPYSRVALTLNGVIHGTALVPANGTLNLAITPFTSTGTAKLVITAQNKITRIHDIQIVPNSGPYVSVSNVVYADSNNNSPEYNETGRFNVTYQNVGTTAATNVTATLTCSTTGITITDNTETIASLNAGASTTINNAYTFNIANNIAHGTTADFTITMVMSGQTPWVHNFSLTINAPALNFGNITISDPSPGNNNGRLDPGETVTVIMPLNNSGGAASPSGSVTLTSPTGGITINNSPQSFSAIAAGGNSSVSFSVTASVGITNGTLASLIFNANAGAYSSNKTEDVIVGIPPSAIIGTGTSTTGTNVASPVNIWYKSSHGQSVYTASELISAGISGPIYITGIGFNIVTTPIYALPNYLVRMKHTTASNVSSWQTADGMETVYTNVSYTPTAGGYDMLTFSTPFLWNGTDNIVIDTAFGLLANYNQSGTVQFTTITDGYRYTWSDTADQTHVFAEGYSSASRPNVKLEFAPYQTAPVIQVSHSTLSYGNVVVNSTSNKQFTIQNIGAALLSGTITTPDGYTVSQARSEETPQAAKNLTVRNTINYSVVAGGSQSFTLTFAPNAEQNYDGNVVITSNDDNNPIVNIAVTGTGYIPVFNPPTALTATGYHAGVYLSWTAPVGSSGTLSSYRVYRNDVLITPSGITTTNYQDTGRTNGVSYQYYVKAVYTNPAGESGNSNIVIATPTPMPPANLIGSGGDNNVLLTWQAPAYATPAFYRVNRNGTFIANITQTTYTDTAVSNGTTYNYYVVAMYSSPTATSPASNSVSVTPIYSTAHTILSGSLTEQGLPFDPYAVYTYSQSIYLQSEINQQGLTINRLFWHYAGGTEFTDAIRIYMGHTDLTAFPSNTSWVPVSEMALVYDGSITTTTEESWIEIPLSTAFPYNNVQNLVIAVDENTPGRHATTDEFYCISVSGARSLMFTSLATNPNPESPPLTGTALVTKQVVPNLKLNFITSAPPLLTLNPTQLNYGSVIIGETSTQTLTINNVSGENITGTITTPAGFSIIQQARGADRNQISFNLGIGQSAQYSVTFEPQAVQSYTGNILVVCDNVVNSTYPAAVTGTGYALPTAILNLDELDCTLGTGESETLNFSICNTGSQTLSFNIEIEDEPSWLRCNPMSGIVSASSCYQVDVDFDSAGLPAGSYYTTIIFNSNDPERPSQTIDVTMYVYRINQAPIINLPPDFSFNKNGQLIVDFTPYVYDADGDNLFLTYYANRNLNILVEGMIVTFSASANWFGTQDVTFTVNDGQLTSSDVVTVNVLPTELPVWEAVIYPNNPATIYGVVTIDGIPVSTDDQVAAFVGDECRGNGFITMNNGQAYTTILVNLAFPDESVYFRIYDSSTDAVYQTYSLLTLTFGEVRGETIPYPINALTSIAMESPVVSIEQLPEGMKLSWAAVPGATRYNVYCSMTPYGVYLPIAQVTACEYLDINVNDACFYRVVASDGSLSRGGAR